MVFGTGTRLFVKAIIKNPDPAVYQLSSKSSNTNVCLLTDFDSQDTPSEVWKSSSEEGVFQTNTTVLDMRSTNSKSNGILAWSNNTDFTCNVASSSQIPFYSSSGIPCNAKLIEKSFESDMNLNLQNLAVIGLRMLLLKVAGFNVLMTLRLWSR